MVLVKGFLIAHSSIPSEIHKNYPEKASRLAFLSSGPDAKIIPASI